MINEFGRFLLTFGLFITIFFLIEYTISDDLTYTPPSFWEAFLHIFNTFNGRIDFFLFTMPFGKLFIVIFMIIFKILLRSVLSAMFINKYKKV